MEECIEELAALFAVGDNFPHTELSTLTLSNKKLWEKFLEKRKKISEQLLALELPLFPTFESEKTNPLLHPWSFKSKLFDKKFLLEANLTSRKRRSKFPALLAMQQ
jgi:hypothetical protein